MPTMPLFDRAPRAAPFSPGEYAARQEVNALGDARASALGGVSFGVGGVSGQMIQQRSDIEGAYLERLAATQGQRQFLAQQNAWTEEDRRRRARELAAARIAQGMTNLGSAAGGYALGFIPAPGAMKEDRTDLPQNVNDDPFAQNRWGLNLGNFGQRLGGI